MRYRKDPKNPSFSSFAAGSHASSLSSAVASSTRPFGVNSDMKCSHVSAAPLKNAIKKSQKCESVGIKSNIFCTTAGFCHFSPSRVAVLYDSERSKSFPIRMSGFAIIFCI